MTYKPTYKLSKSTYKLPTLNIAIEETNKCAQVDSSAQTAPRNAWSGASRNAWSGTSKRLERRFELSLRGAELEEVLNCLEEVLNGF